MKNITLKNKKEEIDGERVTYITNFTWDKKEYSSDIIFFIHGLIESPLVWNQIISMLDSYKCCILYRPIYYDSAKKQNEVEILKKIINHLKNKTLHKNCYVVGHSLGAYICQQLPPELISGRILISPFDSIKYQQSIFNNYNEIWPNINRSFSFKTPYRVKKHYLDLIKNFNLEIINRDILTHTSLPKLQQSQIFKIPTLIIRPKYDIISSRRFNILKSKIPYAEVKILDGGHNILFESPNTTSKEIITFTSSISS